jgi:hypothetical protein
MEHQRCVQGRYATKTIGRDRGMHSARNGGPGDGELLCICTTAYLVPLRSTFRPSFWNTRRIYSR